MWLNDLQTASVLYSLHSRISPPVHRACYLGLPPHNSSLHSMTCTTSLKEYCKHENKSLSNLWSYTRKVVFYSRGTSSWYPLFRRVFGLRSRIVRCMTWEQSLKVRWAFCSLQPCRGQSNTAYHWEQWIQFNYVTPTQYPAAISVLALLIWILSSLHKEVSIFLFGKRQNVTGNPAWPDSS
jgi:hypothetical protein